MKCDHSPATQKGDKMNINNYRDMITFISCVDVYKRQIHRIRKEYHWNNMNCEIANFVKNVLYVLSVNPPEILK